MNVCIQNTKNVRKERNEDNFILSVRLRGAEAVRFWAVMDLAKTRDAYAERTEVVRELLGFDAPRLLTSADIRFFQTGEKQNLEGREIATKSKKKLPFDKSGADGKQGAEVLDLGEEKIQEEKAA